MAEAERIPMDRSQMAEYLGIKGTKECERILDALSPEEWRQYEEFAVVDFQIQLYDKGLGPLPPGVIACGRKQIRHHKGNS